VELVIVLVEVDRTERVDLVACLDAIDAAGVPAALVLVDPDLDNIPELSTTVAVLDHAPDEDFHPEDPESRLRTVDLVDAPDAPPGGADETGAAPDLLPPDDFDDERDGLDDGHGDHEADADVGRESAADAHATPAPGREAPERAEPPEPAAPAQSVEDPATGRPAAVSQDDGELRQGVRVVPGQPGSAQGAGSAPAASAEGDPTGAASEAATGPAKGSDGDERRLPPQRPQSEPSDYEDDDDDPRPPVVGGGHVRTLRARRAAMPMVDPTGEAAPASTGAGHGAAPSPPAAQPGDQPAADQPAEVQPAPDRPAPDRPVSAPQAQPLDEIDTTAREAARLTASLHALANEVWQRGDE